MLEYDKKEVSGSMLNQAEKEIINSALYISLNFSKFKNFVKVNKQSLYAKIYEPYEEEILSKEIIHDILNKYGYEIIKDIRNAEKDLSKTEKQGNIGTIDDHIRWMIMHYNAKHTKDPEVQEIELWRPPQKKIV